MSRLEKVLRTYHEELGGEGFEKRSLREDPAEFVKPVREFDDPNEEKRGPFTVAELQRLLAVAHDEWKSMIRIGLYTGARLSDVALLRWSSIDIERGELRFTARKTAKSTFLPIAGPLQTHIESLPSSDDPNDFLDPRAAQIFSRRNYSAVLSRQFGDLLEQAGLRVVKVYSAKSAEASNRYRANALSFHSLRHTAVSLLKDAGIPMATVLEIVGHSDAQTNAMYTHVGREALERAAAAFPSL